MREEFNNFYVDGNEDDVDFENMRLGDKILEEARFIDIENEFTACGEEVLETFILWLEECGLVYWLSDYTTISGQEWASLKNIVM